MQANQGVRAFCLAAVLSLGWNFWPAPVDSPIDAASIVRRSVEANLRNYQQLPHLNYFKAERGIDGRYRTYEEIMLLGSRYSLLTHLDGEPLPPERAAEERRKLDQARQIRSTESPEQRSRRVSAYERERQRDQFLLNEMANAFEFSLSGEQQVGEHAVYVLEARPRPGYKPPNSRAKVLTGMQGTLWVEKNSFQWVRVEAEVFRPVSIEGFLAQVQPGTRFHLDQEPYSRDVWLPAHYSMKARARVLFFFPKNSDERESYYGYYPADGKEAGLTP